MQDLAKQTGMVLVVPMYEEDAQASGIYYNTAAVIDADGTYLGKYRKTHIPHVKGFWEKFYFRPGQHSATRCSRRRSARSACTSATTATSRRVPARSASTAPRSCSSRRRRRAACREYLWRIEQPSHAVANGYYVGTINRVGIEEEFGDDDFYGQSYFVDPRGQFVGDVGVGARRGADRPRPRPGQDRRGPQHVAVLPRPPARTHTTDLDTPRRRHERYHPRGSAVRRRTAELFTSGRIGTVGGGGRAADAARRRERVPTRHRATSREPVRPMQFGFTLKPDHTIERTLALTRQAEAAGFEARLAVRQPRPVA